MSIEVVEPADSYAFVVEWCTRMNDKSLSARKRAEAVGELHVPDMRHHSPKYRKIHPESGGWIVGTEKFIAWEETAFMSTPSLHYSYDPEDIIAGRGRAFFEYVRHADGQADLDVAERFGPLIKTAHGVRCKISRVYHA